MKRKYEERREIENKERNSGSLLSTSTKSEMRSTKVKEEERGSEEIVEEIGMND